MANNSNTLDSLQFRRTAGPGSNAPAGVGSESSTTPAFASVAASVSISSTNASAEAPTSGGIWLSVS
jgi:hypothetical protein